MIESLISIVFYLSGTLTVLILLLPSQYVPEQLKPSSRPNDHPKPKTSIQILVLGDIGRSPRMQYHALSIAKQGGEVVIIGYEGQYGSIPEMGKCHYRTNILISQQQNLILTRKSYCIPISLLSRCAHRPLSSTPATNYYSSFVDL